MRALELLAPAKNLECGMAAIDHGADAVYIGAPKFGARAAAGNSVEDIGRLGQYAHPFGAKVYVTVNTILFDDELDATRQLLSELAAVHVDAILVQDMALLELRNDCPQLHFHASTQTDNRTAEKVAWLYSLGFARVVLARELSIDEIAAIHRQVPGVELEVFVHGALCVSYSGLCYASQHCFARSANRGACAQFCRMKFDLLDAGGQVIEHDSHLLSLKDLCQIDNLEQLAAAGATSFKIEGRLKDADYVKNVTAAYSQRLNQIIARHPDQYCRASQGRVDYTFAPDLQKTFNRGYTTYFAYGRQADMASFRTPKATGQPVGRVKELRGRSFTVAGTASFANGDGLCFLNQERQLEGFRVNRVEGNRLFPLSMPSGLRPGTLLYRNNDQAFQQQLAKPSAVRKIPLRMQLSATPDGFALRAGLTTVSVVMEHQVAQTPQHENIVRQLSKLGGTPYECAGVDIDPAFPYFIPSSTLSELRRKLVAESLELVPAPNSSLTTPRSSLPTLNYVSSLTLNISNRLSRQFYRQQGLTEPEPAFELRDASDRVPLMQCRYCLRHALGYCTKSGERLPFREPLFLRLSDGRRFRLEFDCRQCQMNVYAAHS